MLSLKDRKFLRARSAVSCPSVRRASSSHPGSVFRQDRVSQVFKRLSNLLHIATLIRPASGELPRPDACAARNARTGSWRDCVLSSTGTAARFIGAGSSP